MNTEGFKNLSKVAFRGQIRPSLAATPVVDAGAYFDHLRARSITEAASVRRKLHAKNNGPLPDMRPKPIHTEDPLLITRHEMQYKPQDTPQERMSQELVGTVAASMVGKSPDELSGKEMRILKNALIRTFSGPLIGSSERRSKIHEGHVLTETPLGNMVTSRRTGIERGEGHPYAGKVVTQTKVWWFNRGEQHPVQLSWETKPTLVVQGVVEDTHYNVTLAAAEINEPKIFTFAR